MRPSSLLIQWGAEGDKGLGTAAVTGSFPTSLPAQPKGKGRTETGTYWFRGK